jgi:hypothetical protein
MSERIYDGETAEKRTHHDGDGMTTEINEPYVTKKDVMEYLTISEATLYRWIGFWEIPVQDQRG